MGGVEWGEEEGGGQRREGGGGRREDWGQRGRGRTGVREGGRTGEVEGGVRRGEVGVTIVWPVLEIKPASF